MLKSKVWWYRASTEERLAQIDGCIDVGLTGLQCAVNCGAPEQTIRGFANKHGRHFRGGYSTARALSENNRLQGSNRHHAMRSTKKAYLAGEPVDFWSAK